VFDCSGCINSVAIFTKTQRFMLDLKFIEKELFEDLGLPPSPSPQEGSDNQILLMTSEERINDDESVPWSCSAASSTITNTGYFATSSSLTSSNGKERDPQKRKVSSNIIVSTKGLELCKKIGKVVERNGRKRYRIKPSDRCQVPEFETLLETNHSVDVCVSCGYAKTTRRENCRLDNNHPEHCEAEFVGRNNALADSSSGLAEVLIPGSQPLESSSTLQMSIVPERSDSDIILEIAPLDNLN
jgi:hypothetical protein